MKEDQAQETHARLDFAIRRIERFHEESGYRERFEHEPVGAPASDEEIWRLEKSLDIRVPNEYRMLLERCKRLLIYEGYEIWGVGDEDHKPGVEEWGGRKGFVCGDYWRDADGDNLVIDLDDQVGSVFIWHHDRTEYEFLAPSLSLALSKIADELFPVEHWEEAVERVQEQIRVSSQPWWRRLFRHS